MVLIERVRKRGVNMVIEANGEVLFGPTGPVASFTRSFSNKARGFAIQAAPTNKRPRWAHYGAPLKKTIKASSRADPVRMRVDAVIGSSSPHAMYVDQGTGIYGGSGPYLAKILPPWTRGGSDLYESTWRVGNQQVREVLIKGQVGQHFFEKGLQKAFAASRMTYVETAGSAKSTKGIEAIPDYLLNFIGNTAATPGFIAQLEEWRAWRDAAFTATRSQRRGTRLSTGRKSRSRGLRRLANPETRKAQARARAKKYRAEQHKHKNKVAPKHRPKVTKAVRAADQSKFLKAMQKKYGASNVDTGSIEYRGGYYYVTVKVGRNFEIVRAKAKV